MTITMERSFLAGMTDYTGAPMSVILSHLRGWRTATADTIENLRAFQDRAERERKKLDGPEDILSYIQYFTSLFERYLGDFERLLNELPHGVSAAHVEIVQQMYSSSKSEEQLCINFKHEHIERSLKDESLRGLIDDVYGESRQMLIDCRDLSNLTPRLRTFVGTTPRIEKEFEQKFRILYSPAQEQVDFDSWIAEGSGKAEYSIGVIFLDVDDFKKLNSALTESVVDRAILVPLQHLVRDSCVHRGGAYRHGGEELLIMLPNCDIKETLTFAEKLRGTIEAQDFLVDAGKSQRLTISSGVAAWPLHGSKLATVIEAANRAESAAKRAGKNRVHVAQDAEQAVEEFVRLSSQGTSDGEKLDRDEIHRRR